MRTTILFLLGLILIISSCSRSDSTIPSPYHANTDRNKLKNIIFPAIENAINNPSGEIVTEKCEEPDFTNCFVLESLELDAWMDISHCSQGLSDSCHLVGSMTINICWDHVNNELLVDFDEDVYAHGIDLGVCVIDEIHFDVQHPADWICEHDAFYDYYIDEMMEIVVDFFGDETLSCDSPIKKLRSRYQKDLCVAVCKEFGGLEKKHVYQSYPCGNKTACCILQESWCVEDDGSITSTVISHETIGDGCDDLQDWPCGEGLGTICYTRDCPNF